jgi:hypothetical protein
MNILNRLVKLERSTRITNKEQHDREKVKEADRRLAARNRMAYRKWLGEACHAAGWEVDQALGEKFGYPELWDPAVIEEDNKVLEGVTEEQLKEDWELWERWFVGQGGDLQAERRAWAVEVVDKIEAIEPELRKAGVDVWEHIKNVMDEGLDWD